MIKYIAMSYGNEIQKIEVIKETDKTVTLPNGSRDYKSTSWKNYFDTFADAFEYLVDRENKAIRRYERQIEVHRENLKEIRNIKEVV
jgi:hypothetical protein